MPRADRLQEVVRRADAHQIARPVGRQQRRPPSRSCPASPPAARRPRARRWHSRRSRCPRARAPRRRAASRSSPPWTMPNSARPGARSLLPQTRACNVPPRRATASWRARARRAAAAGGCTRRAASRCRSRAAPGSPMARSGVSETHRAVEMGAEHHAVLVELAQAGERHHLEAAGVGEDRMRPADESVQAAERRDPLRARPQHQVIGVAEHDVGAGAPSRRASARLSSRPGCPPA